MLIFGKQCEICQVSSNSPTLLPLPARSLICSISLSQHHDPPNPKNEPRSSSRCFHLCCAAYSPSPSLKELPADPVAVITLVCLALLALKKNMNSSVAVTTWVGSDIFSSQLSVTIHSWSLYPPSQWMTHSLSPVTMMSTMSGWTSRAVSIGWYKRKVSGLGKRCNQNNLNIVHKFKCKWP
jgi:hypothetical protein